MLHDALEHIILQLPPHPCLFVSCVPSLLHHLYICTCDVWTFDLFVLVVGCSSGCYWLAACSPCLLGIPLPYFDGIHPPPSLLWLTLRPYICLPLLSSLPSLRPPIYLLYQLCLFCSYWYYLTWFQCISPATHFLRPGWAYICLPHSLLLTFLLLSSSFYFTLLVQQHYGWIYYPPIHQRVALLLDDWYSNIHVDHSWLTN